MTFLQLVQRFCRYCGIPGTGPTSVTSQTGELGRMVNFVIDAWNDIQSEHPDWQWMKATMTPKVTVDLQASYSLSDLAITDFGAWDLNSLRIYKTSDGTVSEDMLIQIPYEVWRSSYQLGVGRTTTGRPTQFAILPDKSIGLGPVPTGDYTLTADYYTAPVALSLDADTPAMPDQHHMAIVYRAMMAYGSYEAAPEVYQRGETEYRRIKNRLETDRLPDVLIGDSLA